jgi:hypothetical protein
MTKPNIFIAHAATSASDREWVRLFAKALANHGAQISWPESQISPGAPLEQAIANGLRNSDIIALIITPESLGRPNLFFELGAAVGMGKRVVPILAEEMSASDIPFPLRSRRGLIRESPETTAAELLETVSSEKVPSPKDN